MKANFKDERARVPTPHNSGEMSALKDLRPSCLLQNQTLVPGAKQKQRLLNCYWIPRKIRPTSYKPWHWAALLIKATADSRTWE